LDVPIADSVARHINLAHHIALGVVGGWGAGLLSEEQDAPQ
jgi:hypothetical protein